MPGSKNLTICIMAMVSLQPAHFPLKLFWYTRASGPIGKNTMTPQCGASNTSLQSPLNPSSASALYLENKSRLLHPSVCCLSAKDLWLISLKLTLSTTFSLKEKLYYKTSSSRQPLHRHSTHTPVEATLSAAVSNISNIRYVRYSSEYSGTTYAIVYARTRVGPNTVLVITWYDISFH